ncbi:hypothetical protein V6N11_042703 [Hibiscus sabdariffa]|uniref:Pentatricopeptide repeat-containing protein n=1 Tax=Hibiscus sabdariffa TaxID=183260 RepID=A0ABR2QX69_9ROSI
MIDNGCAPNIVSYSTMINGYCKVKRFDEAMEFFHEISQKGRIPDNITYNTLMQYMLQLRRVSTANEFLRKMLASGQVPDMVTCSILLNGLCKTGKLEEALEFFQALQNNGLELDIISYNMLIDGLCKAGILMLRRNYFITLRERGFFETIVTRRQHNFSRKWWIRASLQIFALPHYTSHRSATKPSSYQGFLRIQNTNCPDLIVSNDNTSGSSSTITASDCLVHIGLHFTQPGGGLRLFKISLARLPYVGQTLCPEFTKIVPLKFI